MKKIIAIYQIVFARMGMLFLKHSGILDSFFGRWRFHLYDAAEKEGIHIIPVHYYSPLPDTREIGEDDNVAKFFSVNQEALQKSLGEIEGFCKKYGDKFIEIALRKPYGLEDEIHEFRFGIAPYCTVEAEMLYSIIRDKRPKRIIEIGCGHTTLLISEAIRAESEGDYSPRYTCIEPYRPAYLAKPPKEVSEFIELPLQKVDSSVFEELEKGDLLFIDSSHVVKIGSDVVCELNFIVPRLKAGVIVHIHDIFLPYDYPVEWVKKFRFFWNEQYLLSAMLSEHSKYRVVFAFHQLYRERKNDLMRFFPLLKNDSHRPSAYWIEIMK